MVAYGVANGPNLPYYLLGIYARESRPIDRIAYIFINYMSLRSSLKKKVYQYTRNAHSFILSPS